MKPQETGIVKLEDLPQKQIFVCLEEIFFNELNSKIRDFGVYKLAREINVSERILCHWLNKESLIRLDILIRTLNFYSYTHWQDKIKFLRGKDGGKVYNPKLPFDFKNNSGVRLIASILGDGGISIRGDITYSNTNNVLVNDFIKDLNNVFGKVEIYICRYLKKNSIIQVVYPPSFLRHVLNLLGLNNGKKVVNNPMIPSFIYCLSSECKFEFISKMIDDEGSVNVRARHISITLAVENNHINSNILVGIKELLLKEGVHSQIYLQKEYASSRGRNRIRRALQINNFDQLSRLHLNLNIKSKKKSNNLRNLLKSYSQIQYSKTRCKNIYLSKMEEIENERGFFTSSDLATFLNRKVGHVRNMLHKYNSMGIISRIEEAKLTSIGSLPARYIIKNERIH